MNLIEKYNKLKSETQKMLIDYVHTLTFDEAAKFFEDILKVSTEDALIVGLEALEKEEGKYVTALSDSIGCLLWADGNYSMLQPLIAKMDKHEDSKNIYYEYIQGLVSGCSQTRTPLKENELDNEIERLIVIYR